MPDIKQNLSFDASQAIAQINLLNTALAGLNALLGNTGTTIQNWNSAGSSAVTQFTAIKGAADAARKAIELLNASQKQASDLASKSAATSGPSVGALAKIDTSAYLSQIESMSKALGEIPTKASETSRRAYASSIASLADYAAKNQVSMQALNAAWNNHGQVVTGQANKLANLCQNVKTSHQNMASAGGSALGMLSSAWSSMMHIAGGLILHQAINGIISSFREGISTAVDFGKQVADIAIISGNAFNVTADDMQKISNDLIRMSNEFGIALKDVGVGYYRVLSSQIGSSAEVIQVMNAAMSLSVSTMTSLADSTSLLTGALNAYGMKAGSSGELTGIFIKTVELGRARLGDFAEIMGRVYPVASEMGISIEECNAAMVTMTNAGVRADTAVTQLRGILTQLLKPTKELKELMQSEWGVTNAVEAIRLFGGLGPLLQKLQETTKGSNTELIEFFKNVRALTGVLGITSAGIGKMEENLQELREAGSALTDWSKNLVLDTPAKKAEIAYIALKNAMTKFGQSILPVITNLAAMGTVLIQNFQTTFNMLGITNTKYVDLHDAVLALKTREVEALNNADAQRLRAENFKIDAMLTANEQYFNKIGKLRDADLKLLENANKVGLNDTKSTLEDIVSSQEATVRKLEGIIKNYGATVAGINRDVAQENMAWENRQYDLKRQDLKAKGEQHAIQADFDRAEELRTRGLAILKKATTQDEIKEAKALLEASRRKSEALTDYSTQERGLQINKWLTKEKEKESHEDMIRLLNKQKEIAENEKRAAEQRLPIENRLWSEQKETLKEIFDLLSNISKLKNENPAQIAATSQELTSLLNNLKSQVAKGSTDGTTDGKNISIENQTARIDAVKNHWIKSLNELSDSVSIKLTGRLADLFPDVTSLQELKNAYSKAGEESKAAATNAAEVTNQSREYRKNAEAALVAISDAKVDSSDINTNLRTITKTPVEIIPGGMLSEAKTTIDLITRSYNNLLEKGEQAIKSLGSPQEKQRIDEWNYALKLYQDTFGRTNSTTREMQKALDGMTENIKTLSKDPNRMAAETEDDIKRKAEETISKYKEATELIKNIGPVIEEKMGKPIEDTNNKLSGINTVTLPNTELAFASVGPTIEGLINLTQQWGAAAAAVGAQIAANAAAEAAAASSVASTESAPATSGEDLPDMNYSATGGIFASRGTDVLPAMLTPGEFVMNATSSRRFYTQLQAMNAGMRPVFREQGGSVTNVGDINVSVKGGENTHQTAREIAQAVRREIRRGTARLD